MSRRLLQVINLGKRSFADALRTQELIRQRVISSSHGFSAAHAQSDHPGHEDYYPGEPADYLLLVEHWPVYTSGLRDGAFTTAEETQLKALGAEVYKTNRGGLATFHGPGQLVAYPILNLKAHGIGLREYVSRLEQTLVGTCEEMGVSAEAKPNLQQPGVWVKERKIASIGVNAKRHVTMHGVALNCNTDLSWFDHITPCGFPDIEMTSLTKEKGVDVNVSETEWHFLKSFSTYFNSHLSSVSDYVPAAISCQDSQTTINARVY